MYRVQQWNRDGGWITLLDECLLNEALHQHAYLCKKYPSNEFRIIKGAKDE